MQKLTPQQVFNLASFGVLEQGKQARNARNACAYRAPDGCKCAAGHVLPDDLYDPKMEGCAICDYPAKDVFESICGQSAMEVLDCLQSAHDNTQNWSNGAASMAEAFQKIAKRLGLDDNVCLPYLEGAGG